MSRDQDSGRGSLALRERQEARQVGRVVLPVAVQGRVVGEVGGLKAFELAADNDFARVMTRVSQACHALLVAELDALVGNGTSTS